MGYIKNALLLTLLSYSYSILNSTSKDILKNLVNFKLKKYKNEIESISNFIDYCIDNPKPIQKDDIDFQFINDDILKNKSKELFESIEKINEFSLENDLNDIIVNNKKKNKERKSRNVK